MLIEIWEVKYFLLIVNQPNVTEMCFRQAYGEPEPNSVEEAVQVACVTTGYEQIMKQRAMLDCFQSSDELIYNIFTQSFKNSVRTFRPINNHWPINFYFVINY